MTNDPYLDRISSHVSGMSRALDAGDGIVRLAPSWVPRSFCTPGRRIRLHPDDYFPFQQTRGGIDERWLASTVRAENGPLTGPYEGLSLVVDPDGTLLPFDEFVSHHGAAAVGERLWEGHGGWTMYSKFYDNLLPLPFHVHHDDEKAALVGKVGKPEAYYYSPQMNNYLGDQSISYLGLRPGTSRDQVRERLARFGAGGDNRITELALGYRTQLGTGWDVPSGVLHAPASICTYEPQSSSDVFSMCESWSNNREVPEELLWKDVPESRHGDVDAVLDLLDWEKNVDPDFVANRFMAPYETKASEAAGGRAYVERWIVYRSNAFSAKELTVAPGETAVITEDDAYGAIVVQGHGTLGSHDAAAATVIRFGQLSQDEFFVTAEAARAGVRVHNASPTEELVVLKHFGPGNVELGLV
ncbi:hypothetical protein GCM10023221_35250 [Luteimicrobium xylanilyticum]|uniref:Mannose-6-phosphate isomerase n=1 Tax=Luteimicrobium xylanilyticum TaxID=1133546 RepID=A0A5P9Q7U1_9MICO|nr:hypothetical protein [Luteimicrobium xylanilyticum]QFU97160.1 hypothetical protein KDY119_00654 [Luteimicrobium xylanilyticum]